MAKGRLLVVDDDANIRELVEMVLLDEGYEVVTAPDGATALAMLPRARPDLILLDMKMPVMDGWEFARRYRDVPSPKAPIVVITAAHDAPRRARDVGAESYLAKPFGIDELLQVVDAHKRCA
jgi:two-component system chemotaxis response regulator CheY